jgi:hypothetical protein
LCSGTVLQRKLLLAANSECWKPFKVEELKEIQALKSVFKKNEAGQETGVSIQQLKI